MFHASNSNGTYANCLFENGNAVNGGAIDARSNSFVQIIDSTLQNNIAMGGMVQLGDSSTGTVINSKFINNYAKSDSGAIGISSKTVTFFMSDSLLQGNVAKRNGGAIGMREMLKSMKIINTKFIDTLGQ